VRTHCGIFGKWWNKIIMFFLREIGKIMSYILHELSESGHT